MQQFMMQNQGSFNNQQQMSNNMQPSFLMPPQGNPMQCNSTQGNAMPGQMQGSAMPPNMFNMMNQMSHGLMNNQMNQPRMNNSQMMNMGPMNQSQGQMNFGMTAGPINMGAMNNSGQMNPAQMMQMIANMNPALLQQFISQCKPNMSGPNSATNTFQTSMNSSQPHMGSSNFNNTGETAQQGGAITPQMMMAMLNNMSQVKDTSATSAPPREGPSNNDRRRSRSRERNRQLDDVSNKRVRYEDKIGPQGEGRREGSYPRDDRGRYPDRGDDRDRYGRGGRGFWRGGNSQRGWQNDRQRGGLQRGSPAPRTPQHSSPSRDRKPRIENIATAAPLAEKRPRGVRHSASPSRTRETGGSVKVEGKCNPVPRLLRIRDYEINRGTDY